MIIVGIGGSQHDFSFCVLRDGEILVAIEEERISREKHCMGLRSQALSGLNYCLKSQNLTINDIDVFVSNNAWGMSSFTLYPYYSRIAKIDHHMAHACVAYYNSGFDESCLLVIDGAGDNYRDRLSETISFGEIVSKKPYFYKQILGEEKTYDDFLNLRKEFYSRKSFNKEIVKKNQLEKLVLTENSLGDMYSLISYCCGFTLLSEGKTMGLAPYGTDRYVKELSTFIEYSYDEQKRCKINVRLEDMYNFLRGLVKREDSLKKRADLAYAAQAVLEEAVFFLMNGLYERTHCKNLCYSGGVALNSVLNGKIKRNTPFKNIYIYPAAGDSGTSIGAAMYAYYVLGGNSYKPKRNNTCYYGIGYDDERIKRAIQCNDEKIVGIRLENSQCIENAAQMLSAGKIIGWFQNGSEFGPRALGNRSILADPRCAEMKDILNKKVKFREEFRPFAPVVTQEDVLDYFDTDFPDNPHMLYVADVKKEKRKFLGAVTHVDGSARFQTITRSQNPKYYDVIKEFQRLTSIPILLNTSLNIKGRPIVECPEEAIECLVNSQMDALFIENWCILKKHEVNNSDDAPSHYL